MGAPANSFWLPLMLLMAMAQMTIAQSNDTATDGNISSTSSAPDLLVRGDLSKAARVEQLSSEMDNEESAALSTPRPTDAAATGNEVDAATAADGGPYDVIDVMAATSAGVGGKPKSGQTTRIYTTGDVNDAFWLKHLGDDFKHAIHLQVGGTNEDYNRIINQTRSDGVHEEVHHEYLPGAERPPEFQQQQQRQQQQQQQQRQQFGQANLISQLSLDGEGMSLKENYLRQQQQQRYAQANGYATQPHNAHYAHTQNTNSHTHTYATHQHQHQNQQPQPQQSQLQPHTQTRTRGSKPRLSLRNRYKQQQQQQALSQQPPSSIINSSEDTLHAAQSQATLTSAASPSNRGSSSGSASRSDNNPLPFKSPFNDYGSRPTRDLTYLLYKRGL